MIDSYFLILSFTSTLNEWNEKLNGLASEHLDNVWVGVIILGIIMAFVIFGINTLSK